MTDNERLRRHLELCKRVYERMKRDGTWPWKLEAESPKSNNVVESKDAETDV